MRFTLKKFKDGTHYLGADADDVEVSEVYGLAAYNTMHNITMMASLSMDKAGIDPDAGSAKSALIAVAEHLRGLIESAAVTVEVPRG